MAVSKRLRFEILNRDNHTCQLCGRSAPEVKLHVDHVIPVTLGGSDDPANLQAACADCNIGKSSVPADAPAVARVSEDARRWAQAMQQVAEMRAAELDDQFALVDWFMSEWNAWTNWRNETYDADDAPASIPQFVKAGLTRQEMKELIAVAVKSPATDKWRYFCGCCWKRIRQNQELAAEIVNSESATEPSLTQLSTVWTVDEMWGFITESLNRIGEALGREVGLGDLRCEHGPECGDMLCRLCCTASLTGRFHEHFSREKVADG